MFREIKTSFAGYDEQSTATADVLALPVPIFCELDDTPPLNVVARLALRQSAKGNVILGRNTLAVYRSLQKNQITED